MKIPCFIATTNHEVTVTLAQFFALFTFLSNHPNAVNRLDRDQDGFSVRQGDCDDFNNTVYPGVQESCDEYDNDCDGLVDEDDPDAIGGYWFGLDLDGDGYGVSNEQFNVYQCPSDPPTPAYVMLTAYDCDDSDDTVYPFALEIAGDGIDQNCDQSDVETEFVISFDVSIDDQIVLEALPGDERVYFGSWTMYANDDHNELVVRQLEVKVAVSEDPDGNWTSYMLDYTNVAPADYLEDCVLVNTDSDSVIAGPINPDAYGSLTFEDEFIVTDVPLTVDIECDFTSLIPAAKLGFGIADNWSTDTFATEWQVESLDGDSIHVRRLESSNYNLERFTPNLSVELLPN